MAVAIDLSLDVPLVELQLHRFGLGFRRRFGRRLRLQSCSAGQRDPNGAGARERECEFGTHLSDPPGSTPPRDCAAARDRWLCRRDKTAPRRQKLDIARADCLEATCCFRQRRRIS